MAFCLPDAHGVSKRSMNFAESRLHSPLSCATSVQSSPPMAARWRSGSRFGLKRLACLAPPRFFCSPLHHRMFFHRAICLVGPSPRAICPARDHVRWRMCVLHLWMLWYWSASLARRRVRVFHSVQLSVGLRRCPIICRTCPSWIAFAWRSSASCAGHVEHPHRPVLRT